MRKPSGNYKFADRFRYRNNGIYNNDIMKKWLSLIILLAVNVISINAQQKNLYLANLHTSFLCNLIYPTFSRILLYSC